MSFNGRCSKCGAPVRGGHNALTCGRVDTPTTMNVRASVAKTQTEEKAHPWDRASELFQAAGTHGRAAEGAKGPLVIDMDGADLSGQGIGWIAVTVPGLPRTMPLGSLSDYRPFVLNLRGADLRHAVLGWGSPVKMNIAGARANFLRIPGKDLSGSDFSGADLRNADLGRATLDYADLSGATIGEGRWRTWAKEWMHAIRAVCGQTNLGLDKWRKNPEPRIFRDDLSSDLQSTSLRHANLRGADLRGIQLRNAKMEGANLTGADLRGAKLEGADLSRANLTGADFRGADLTGVNFEGAQLHGAKGLEK